VRCNNSKRGLDRLFGILDLQTGDLGIGGSRAAEGSAAKNDTRGVAQRYNEVEGAAGRAFTATTLQNVLVGRSASKRRANL
jgi:hypothetical protein